MYIVVKLIKTFLTTDFYMIMLVHDIHVITFIYYLLTISILL